MKENKKITSNDKIPGCERLTRPEEIKGLSKYLGAIREVQETWIEENMPDETEDINVEDSEITSLPDAVIGITPEEARIKTDRIGLSVPSTKLHLDIDKLKVEENINLPKNVDKIYPTEPSELPKKKDTIDTPYITSLPDGVIGIDPEKVKSLPETKLNIKVPKEELRREREDLRVPETELKRGREDLRVPETELKRGREDLRVPEARLNRGKEKLDVKEDLSLGNFIDTIIDDRETKLPNSTVGLRNIKDVNLPTTRLDIEDQEISLPDKKLKIKDIEVSLPDKKEMISPKDVEKPDLRYKSPRERSGKRNLIIDDTTGDTKYDTTAESFIDPEKPDYRYMSPKERAEERKFYPSSNPGEDRFDKEIESILALDAESEYRKILEILNPKTGAEMRNSGNLKLAGIISAFLGNKEMTEDQVKAAGKALHTYFKSQRVLVEGAMGDGSKKERSRGEDDTESARFIKESDLGKDKLRQRAPDRVGYKLPEKDLLSFNTYDYDTYLRYLAELAVYGTGGKGSFSFGSKEGTELSGWARKTLLDTTLRALTVTRNLTEKVLGLNRDRLPGIGDSAKLNDIGAGIKGVITGAKKVINSATSGNIIGTITGLLPQENKDRNRPSSSSEKVSPVMLKGDHKPTIGHQGSNFMNSNIDVVGKYSSEKKLPGWEDTQDEDYYNYEYYSTDEHKYSRLYPGDPRNSENPVDKYLLKKVASNYVNENPNRGRSRQLMENALKTREAWKNTPETIDVSDEPEGGWYIANEVPVFDDNGNEVGSEITSYTISNPQRQVLFEQGKAQYEESTQIANILDNTQYGLGLTLSDLCPNHGEISSISDLKKELINSPYITNPEKTIKPGGGNQTLDTNAYWEVIIEPLCRKDLNGGWSYLPSISEINQENFIEHGVNTAYSKWIPISDLSLQKSRLNSKTLGLYDGEISYPVSVEFTNEFRITVIDDQYKSWRRYFQRCADVSVYSSEAHNEEWYKRAEDSTTIRPTAIDKTKFCVSYYKNVAFRIRVYFMTPQYSTIKKYDLLCTLKDFSEEYVGEIDAGGSDLNISFSIVGENPDDNSMIYKVTEDGAGWTTKETEKITTVLGANLDKLKRESDTIINAEEKVQPSSSSGGGGRRSGKITVDPQNSTCSYSPKVIYVNISATSTAGDPKIIQTVGKFSKFDSAFGTTVDGGTKTFRFMIPKNTAYNTDMVDEYTIASGSAKETIHIHYHAPLSAEITIDRLDDQKSGNKYKYRITVDVSSGNRYSFTTGYLSTGTFNFGTVDLRKDHYKLKISIPQNIPAHSGARRAKYTEVAGPNGSGMFSYYEIV